MNIHGSIMNLPCSAAASEDYKLGHRDARHEAAKLASSADVETSRLVNALCDVLQVVSHQISPHYIKENAVLNHANDLVKDKYTNVQLASKDTWDIVPIS